MNFEQMLLEDFNKSPQNKVVLTKEMEEQIINEALESLYEGILGSAASGIAVGVATGLGKVVKGARWVGNTKVVKGLFGKNRQHPDYRPHNDPNHRDYDPTHPDFNPDGNNHIPSLFNSMISKAANANGRQNGNSQFSYNTNMMQQLNQQNSMQ